MDKYPADALYPGLNPLLYLVGQAMGLCDRQVGIGQAVEGHVVAIRARPDVESVVTLQAGDFFGYSRDLRAQGLFLL
ncbi:MAG: hypothetical protein P8186_19300 [Anaerolineae bacterium]